MKRACADWVPTSRESTDAGKAFDRRLEDGRVDFMDEPSGPALLPKTNSRIIESEGAKGQFEP